MIELTQKRLKELLKFDFEAANYRWRVHRTHNAKVGDLAGTICKTSGHRFISIDGKPYSAAQIAWFYVYGCRHNGELVHKDNNLQNNNIENLKKYNYFDKNLVLFFVDNFPVTLHHHKNRNPRHIIHLGEDKKFLHHYLVEKHIRALRPGEVAHHKDGNPLNDHINNLEIMSRAEHIRHHKPVLGYKFTPEQKLRLSKAHIGQKAWNKGLRGFKHSEQSKANMSKAQKGRVITWGEAISKSQTKVTREQLLDFIKTNPKATAKDIMEKLLLKSKSPIFKNGGLRKLRREATR